MSSRISSRSIPSSIDGGSLSRSFSMAGASWVEAAGRQAKAVRVAEGFPQFLQGSPEQLLHCLRGSLHALGDFLERQALDPGEADDLLVIAAQGADGALEALEAL